MTSGSRRSASGVLPESQLAAIEGHLRTREARRDGLYERARGLRRAAQGFMNRLHDGAADASEGAALRRSASELEAWVRAEARGDESLARDALQEAVEALLLEEVIAERPLSGPAELGVDPEVFLLGLGDLAGEIRRLVLGSLSRGDLGAAERRLELLEGVYRDLMRFDTSRAVVSLKPKQDVARALLERTRGDVVLARLLARGGLAGPAPSEGP